MSKKNKNDKHIPNDDVTVDGYRQDRGEVPDTDKIKKGGVWRKIPALLRAWLINAWFGGAVFLFIGWGIPHITTDNLDLVAAFGLALGLAGDIIVNKIHIALLSDVNPKIYMMYHTKSVLSVIVNCLYGIALAILITLIYALVNLSAASFGWVEAGGIWLGAEPILVGVFYGSLNLLFVTVKNLIKKLTMKNE